VGASRDAVQQHERLSGPHTQGANVRNVLNGLWKGGVYELHRSS
jgi:hypothetical protein